MTKENFINKWASVYNVNDTTNPYFVTDLDAVIAYEIPKAKEAKPQPELNPIEQAYERGEKIRHKNWPKDEWIKKHSESQAITNLGDIFVIVNLINTIEYFTTPQKWELYTEPEQPEPKYPIGGYAPGHYTCICVNCKEAFMGDKRAVQCESCAVKTTSQPAKPFDKERFEAMFRAVIETHEATMNALKQLDAYYAEKGGNNG